MKDKISDEIKTAMKAKDKVRLNVLRYVKKLLIENETSKKPINEMDVVIGHAKKMTDSLNLYPEGSEQRVGIEEEIAVLKEFLPQPLTEQEVVDQIKGIITSLDNPNMGAVMKELSGKIKGRFDGKRATQLVNETLNN